MRLELEGVRRLVERDPGPERTERHAQRAGRRRGCSPRRTAAGPGAASVDSSARSYWPRTRVPMNPSRKPELAGRDPAIGERHRRLGEPAAGRDDLVEQVRLELAHERPERPGVGADPAGPIDDARSLDDARQRAAERGRQGRDDPRHRLGVGGFGGRELRGVERPAGGAQPGDRDPLDLRPVDQPALAGRPLGVAAGDGRGGTQRGADEEAGLPDAVVAPRRASAGCAERSVIGRPPRDRSVRPPGRRTRTAGWRGAWNVSGSPVVSWTCVAGA